ncbi:MAG: hypothetical protein JKY15_03670 [Deltaproteobacteria bacterium]|nr:hypothetical protein [Deltaproteobacteria bacterium]
MIISNLKALEGLLWGVALGDGMCRMHRFRQPPFLLHSAVGTWFLAVFQSALGFGELALKLEILAAPSRAKAFRGTTNSLASTLQEVARGHPTHQLLADALPCWMPICFGPQDEEEFLNKLIEWVHVTHWHPRVISAAALLVGSMRAMLVDTGISLEGQLEQGERLADKVLHLLFDRKEADTPQAIWQAHQALKYHVAVAKGALEPSVLQVPSGFDGRDSPEQLVVYALALTEQRSSPEEDLCLVSERCGSSDILRPLVSGLAGFRQGVLALPEAPLQKLWARDLWHRHLSTLAYRDPYFPCLVEAEIELSGQEVAALKELDHFCDLPQAKNQLTLFENQTKETMNGTF